ncbi:MAG: hypothetical protein KF784_08075 [Fimbriimonadaceae bacterium]|nr:hypothetical protein [Fimbriimonadaceae bacterium]
MFNQVFETSDLGKVAFLILLEALLSADNALILAIIVRHLPKPLQRKALFYGMAGAFTFRLGAILAANLIISLWWVQLIGAAYLIFLMVKHFWNTNGGGAKAKGLAGASFWVTVLYAELADLAFAIDSILVAVAIEPHRDKIWVVYCGAVLGIVLLRFIANVFLRLLEKYPMLDHVAYILVGWAGIKLLFLGGHTCVRWFNERNPLNPLGFTIPEMKPLVFWTGLALIAIIGGWLAFRQGPQPLPDDEPGESGQEAATEPTN